MGGLKPALDDVNSSVSGERRPLENRKFPFPAAGFCWGVVGLPWVKRLPLGGAKLLPWGEAKFSCAGVRPLLAGEKLCCGGSSPLLVGAKLPLGISKLYCGSTNPLAGSEKPNCVGGLAMLPGAFCCGGAKPLPGPGKFICAGSGELAGGVGKSAKAAFAGAKPTGAGKPG